jgi:hypothetical protein
MNKELINIAKAGIAFGEAYEKVSAFRKQRNDLRADHPCTNDPNCWQVFEDPAQYCEGCRVVHPVWCELKKAGEVMRARRATLLRRVNKFGALYGANLKASPAASFQKDDQMEFAYSQPSVSTNSIA